MIIYKKGCTRLMRVTIEVHVTPNKDSNHEDMLLATAKEIQSIEGSRELTHSIMDMEDITSEDCTDDDSVSRSMSLDTVMDFHAEHERIHAQAQKQNESKVCRICHTDPPWHKLDCPLGRKSN